MADLYKRHRARTEDRRVNPDTSIDILREFVDPNANRVGFLNAWKNGDLEDFDFNVAYRFLKASENADVELMEQRWLEGFFMRDDASHFSPGPGYILSQLLETFEFDVEDSQGVTFGEVDVEDESSTPCMAYVSGARRLELLVEMSDPEFTLESGELSFEYDIFFSTHLEEGGSLLANFLIDRPIVGVRNYSFGELKDGEHNIVDFLNHHKADVDRIVEEYGLVKI